MAQTALGAPLVLALDDRLFSDVLAAALSDAGVEACVAARSDLTSLGPCDLRHTVMVDVRSCGDVDALPELTGVARFLVLAYHVDEQLLARVFARGGAGLVGPEASLDDIRNAVAAVARGATVIRGVRPGHLRGATPGAASLDGDAAPTLTDRELEILTRVAHGASTRDVAEELGITTNTARTHIRNILGKLHVHSRLEASAVATRKGLVRSAGPAHYRVRRSRG